MSSLTLVHRNQRGKNLRELRISAPISTETDEVLPTLRSPVAPVVILRAKYDFHAQESGEICVRSNELLMLLERRGGGWIYVQCLDRSAKGLIPSLYTEIVVNDAHKPVTIDWFSEAQLEPADGKCVDRVIVSLVLLSTSHRLCYRVEAVLKCDRIVTCYKVYEDFQVLQVAANNDFSEERQFHIPAQLVSHVSPVKCTDTAKKQIVSVALGLNGFLQNLCRFLALRSCTLLVDFLLNDHRNLISDRAPVVVDLLDKSLDIFVPGPRLQSFSTTVPLPPMLRPTYKHCVSLPKESYVVKEANRKYLTYLCSSDSAKKENVSRGLKTNSIASILSLIESYDIESWDVYDQPARLGAPQNCADLHSLPQGQNINAPCAPLEHLLSSSYSTTTASTLCSKRSSSTVNSAGEEGPVTQPLDHLSILAHVPAAVKDAEDLDLGPLQPRMHRKFIQAVNSA